MEEFHVEFRHVEPDIVPIDFEGVHLILTGIKAFFYKFLSYGYSEEYVQELLYPYLLDEKMKAADVAKQNAASSQEWESKHKEIIA